MRSLPALIALIATFLVVIGCGNGSAKTDAHDARIELAASVFAALQQGDRAQLESLGVPGRTGSSDEDIANDPSAAAFLRVVNGDVHLEFRSLQYEVAWQRQDRALVEVAGEQRIDGGAWEAFDSFGLFLVYVDSHWYLMGFE